MADPATLPTLATDLDYQHVVDARFIDIAAREGLAHVKGYTWTAAPAELDALGLELLASAEYEFGGQREALVRVEDCLAHVILMGDSVTARVAAPAHARLAAAEGRLREILPPRSRRNRRRRAVVRFWADTAYEGPTAQPRELDTVRWADVAANYPQPTRGELARLATGFRPGEGGRLLLWHGAPGTGKTYAIRALAWEWRRWCDVHYVTDPEAMLGRDPAYLGAVLGLRGRGMPRLPPPARAGTGTGTGSGAARGRSRARPRWRLIVLEDSGELLAPDARREVGQGLSRLLNSVDGLLGQGARALVLITTNEELAALHPAIARPGRCAARVEFATFGAGEAARWLAARGVAGPAGGDATLAELYARAQSWPGAGDASAEPVGFAAALPGG